MRSRARFAARLGVAAVAAAAVALPMASAGATAMAGATWTGTAGGPARVVVWTAKAPAPPEPDEVLQAAAKRFGLPARRIAQALVAVKESLAKSAAECTKVDLLDPAVLRVFARSLGSSVRTATALMKYLIAAWEKAARDAKPKPGAPAAVPPEAVAVLAAVLAISPAKARTALQRLFTLDRWTATDPAFGAVARSLKITPKRLQDAMAKVKRALAEDGSKPGKPGDPKPKPGDPGCPKPGEPKPGEPKPGEPKQPAPVEP